MKEKDNSRVYIKYKDQRKVVKIKSKELTRGCGFYIDENVEEIIIENCYLDDDVWLTTKNSNTKVILRNCTFDELVVENGKVYLTDIDARYIKGINNNTFALKESNEINQDMYIKANTVFISGNLKETKTEIDAERVIISSAIIDTFFDFFVRTKKLNISNSNFKSSTVLSLDYQQALVTKTNFNTYIFETNGTRYNTNYEKIVISDDTTKNEEYLKSYLWLNFLKSLRDKVEIINKRDYENTCKQITEETAIQIKEYKDKIDDLELEIQILQNKIKNQQQIEFDKKNEKRKVLIERKIGSIESVINKR